VSGGQGCRNPRIKAGGGSVQDVYSMMLDNRARYVALLTIKLFRGTRAPGLRFHLLY
jgi:hypothetical protein